MVSMQYRIGSTITYSAFGGELRTGVVTEKDDDIKNGEPGFVMTVNRPASPIEAEGWGYDDQIVRVDKY